jgi:hypothetical protein
MLFFVMFVHVYMLLLMRGVSDSTIYFYKPFYIFDLRAIESSMLFAVFRPLRTPVPNGQSSHILERPWPVDGS